MYSVGVNRIFTAIHALVGDVPEEEKVPHEHEYKLEWIFQIHELDSRGFSLDIALLERIVAQMCDSIVGVNLNEMDFFTERNSSLENLCAYIQTELWSRVSEQLNESDRKRIRSMEIKIWENDFAWAGISRDFLTSE